MFLLDGLKLETGRSRKKIKLHFAKACKSYSSILKHAVLGAKVVKLFVSNAAHCELNPAGSRPKARGWTPGFALACGHSTSCIQMV